MARKISTVTIGVFVAGAIALAMAAMVVLGSGVLFSRNESFVVYFPGSVKGLRVGAPVTFRGVTVGQVEGIRVTFDSDDYSFDTPITIAINPKRIGSRDLESDWMMSIRGGIEKLTRRLITKGLRAQLEMQSFVTGQLLVNLDFHEDSELTWRGSPEDSLPEIPTLPSEFDEFSKTIEELPISEIIADLQSTLKGLSKMANSGRLDEVFSEAEEVLEAAQGLLRHVDGVIDPTSQELQVVLGGLKALLDEVSTSVGSVRRSVTTAFNERGEGVLQQTSMTLEQVERAARSIRALADYLERNPEGVVFGRK